MLKTPKNFFADYRNPSNQLTSLTQVDYKSIFIMENLDFYRKFYTIWGIIKDTIQTNI